MTTKLDEQITEYTTKQASDHAIVWCANHPGWKRICDIPDTDSLYLTWAELTAKQRKSWVSCYGRHNAEAAWLEYGSRPCKVKYGFISGAGEFYERVTDVPLFHNFMMVYEVGED